MTVLVLFLVWGPWQEDYGLNITERDQYCKESLFGWKIYNVWMWFLFDKRTLVCGIDLKIENTRKHFPAPSLGSLLSSTSEPIIHRKGSKNEPPLGSRALQGWAASEPREAAAPWPCRGWSPEGCWHSADGTTCIRFREERSHLLAGPGFFFFSFFLQVRIDWWDPVELMKLSGTHKIWIISFLVVIFANSSCTLS